MTTQFLFITRFNCHVAPVLLMEEEQELIF